MSVFVFTGYGVVDIGEVGMLFCWVGSAPTVLAGVRVNKLLGAHQTIPAVLNVFPSLTVPVTINSLNRVRLQTEQKTKNALLCK